MGTGLYTDKLMPSVVEGAALAGGDPGAVDKMIGISYDPDPEVAPENTHSGHRCR